MSEEKLIKIKESVEKMSKAFGKYSDAIERAQRSYHNYQEWSNDEWEPINEAENDFYVASEEAHNLLNK